MTGQTALITGASSGIGSELTKLFAAGGQDVVLVARREERLRELASEVEDAYDVTATVIAQDLATPEGPRELYDAVQERGIDVYTLVNNAGFGNYGHFHETDLERETTMIDLNVTAVTRLTKLFITPMFERDDGEILITASMAGMAPIPKQAVYCSSKAYARSFGEALSHEYDDTGITVTTLCPGPVDTEFAEADDFDGTGFRDRMVDPQTVAQAGYDGLKGGKRIVIPSWRMKTFLQLQRVLPRSTAVWFADREVGE